MAVTKSDAVSGLSLSATTETAGRADCSFSHIVCCYYYQASTKH